MNLRHPLDPGHIFSLLFRGSGLWKLPSNTSSVATSIGVLSSHPSLMVAELSNSESQKSASISQAKRDLGTSIFISIFFSFFLFCLPQGGCVMISKLTRPSAIPATASTEPATHSAQAQVFRALRQRLLEQTAACQRLEQLLVDKTTLLYHSLGLLGRPSMSTFQPPLHKAALPSTWQSGLFTPAGGRARPRTDDDDQQPSAAGCNQSGEPRVILDACGRLLISTQLPSPSAAIDDLPRMLLVPLTRSSTFLCDAPAANLPTTPVCEYATQLQQSQDGHWSLTSCVCLTTREAPPLQLTVAAVDRTGCAAPPMTVDLTQITVSDGSRLSLDFDVVREIILPQATPLQVESALMTADWGFAPMPSDSQATRYQCHSAGLLAGVTVALSSDTEGCRVRVQAKHGSALQAFCQRLVNRIGLKSVQTLCDVQSQQAVRQCADCALSLVAHCMHAESAADLDGSCDPQQLTMALDAIVRLALVASKKSLVD